MQKTFEKICVHHDIFRTVFKDTKQEILSSQDYKKFELIVKKINDTNDVKEYIESYNTSIQGQLNIENGPLIKAVLFKIGNTNELMISVHHLVMDGLSWRILIEDLESTYLQLIHQDQVVLPKKTASYKLWSEALVEYRKSDVYLNSVSYWKNINEKLPQLCEIKIDKNTSQYAKKKQKFSITEELTEKLLYKANSAYGTDVEDLLLSALGMTVYKISNQEEIAIQLEGHGRNTLHKPVDVDRTIGWFTTVYPVVIECSLDISKAITETKEILRKLPHNGLGYGIYMQTNPKANHVNCDICFNYLGQVDNEILSSRMFEKSIYSVGKSIDDNNLEKNKLTINCMIAEGRFVCEIEYYGINRSCVDALMIQYKNYIEQIISHCVAQDKITKTGSDYGSADLTLAEIDEILDLF